MSRGPGKLEQAIEAVFVAEPDDAHTTEDLIDRVFPGLNAVEKKHRVTVIRAAKKVSMRLGWRWERKRTLGKGLVFFNSYSLMSYGMMMQKSESYNLYRTGDPRMPLRAQKSAEELRRRLEPGERDHGYIAEGSYAWRRVQLWIAERDGDTETADKIRNEINAVTTALFRGSPPPDTLLEPET